MNHRVRKAYFPKDNQQETFYKNKKKNRKPKIRIRIRIRYFIVFFIKFKHGKKHLQNQNKMAERTGFEPATPGVTGRYSNQLNYRSEQV